ncbi:MAG TPA: PHP domain-containing protein [Gemmatimonadaceae bacterium]|nr:PHP domain-containing protein [Gemmatimonadaceae bacterium]
MDPRTAAHALSQIAAHLELRGESRFRIRAYEQAARALVSLETDDLGALDRAGTLAATRGLGPATLSIVRDLIATGESRYLEQLRADTPAGLLDLLRVPGLAPPKIHLLYESLGIDSVDALETAALDGRLKTLKGFGPRTAQKILAGIGFFRSSGTRVLHHRGAAAARTLLAMVRGHPGVSRAEVAGSVRRHGETVGDTDIVAACRADPLDVAVSCSRAPGVRAVTHGDTASPSLTYADGARLDLHCVAESEFAVAFWRATGAVAHVAGVSARLAARGLHLAGDSVRDARGNAVPVPDEAALYALAGMAFVPPEMREAHGEIERAASGPIAEPLALSDIRGALHCHSTWSDGKATIAAMADAARARGWEYIGITDHSQAAFYAGGLSGDQVLMQHDEIDALNAAAGDGFRILKGIEADILADGALDYDDALLDRFDFVVGSVHSRFAMDERTMTERVLRALDDPHLTVLGHPTGRLLLSRDAYAIDMQAVLEHAAERGVAIEINADPHRLDLDWRLIPSARSLGATFEIGPDAHSPQGLDNMSFGVGIARKGSIGREEVLNARPASDVVSFARARRAGVR